MICKNKDAILSYFWLEFFVIQSNDYPLKYKYKLKIFVLEAKGNNRKY